MDGRGFAYIRSLCQSQVLLPSSTALPILQGPGKMAQRFSECPNNDDAKTSSGQCLRYKARWTQPVLLPIALVLTHLLKRAKACLEWRRKGSQWAILYPSRLPQNQSSVLSMAGSFNTHQHCVIGIQIRKETIFILPPQHYAQEVQSKKERSKGKRSSNLWTQSFLKSKSSHCTCWPFLVNPQRSQNVLFSLILKFLLQTHSSREMQMSIIVMKGPTHTINKNILWQPLFLC